MTYKTYGDTLCVNDYIICIRFCYNTNVNDYIPPAKQEVIRVTIQEIAVLAGVSVATVSRVINNSKTVSEKTREHVLKVMDEHNYQPNILGRHLRTQQTKIILVILTSISNYFCNRVVNGIDDEAKARIKRRVTFILINS